MKTANDKARRTGTVGAVEIRESTPGMLLAISSLQVRSRRKAYGHILPPASRDVTPEAWAVGRTQWLAKQGAEFRSWAGYEGERLVGFCDTGFATDRDLRGGTREVLLLYVDAGLSGRGYGKALLGHATSDLTARSSAPIVLWTPEDNAAARAFYEGMHWRPDGASRAYTPFGTAAPIGREVRYAWEPPDLTGEA